jgi:hypothetical protein
MASDPLPSEALDTHRELSENGSAANVSAPMLEFLITNGYVEMEDRVPVVTDAGLNALGANGGTPIPPLAPDSV